MCFILANKWFVWIVHWLTPVPNNISDWTVLLLILLQVARKSTAQHQDYAPAVPWPRGVKGPSYPSASFLRSPIPKGIPGAFRPRPPIKFGARSLQWKRGVQGTSSGNGATLNNSSISAPVSRGLTYVRAESKLNGKAWVTGSLVLQKIVADYCCIREA